MAISTARLQEFYLAYYGRPGDTGGLNYWSTVSPTSESILVTNFGSALQKEFVNLYGSTPSTATFVNAVYTNLFGREADTQGLNYWVGQFNTKLAAGQSADSIRAAMVIWILDGAQAADAAIIDAKITAAQAWTAALNTTDEVVAYNNVDNTAGFAVAREWLSKVLSTATVTSQVALLDDAVAEMVGVDNSSNIFTLTTGLDTLPGMTGSNGTDTTGNDTVFAVVNAAGSTLTLGDQINAGAGSDLLRVVTDQTDVTLAGADIANIEKFRLESNSDDFDSLNLNNVAFQSVTLDFKGAVENDGIEADVSNGGINNLNQGSALTIKNLDLNGHDLDINYAALGAINNSVTFKDVSSGDGEADIAIDFNHPVVAGNEVAGGTYTINLDAASDLEIDIVDGSAQTLNINVLNDSTDIEIDNDGNVLAKNQSVTVNLNLAADLTGDDWDLADVDTTGTGTLTVNIAGAGDLDLDGLDADGGPVTVAGSTASGSIKIDFESEAKVKSVTTGSGDDEIDLDIAYFDGVNTVTVALGSGTNILGINEDGFDDADIDALDFTKINDSGLSALRLNGNVTLADAAEFDFEGLSTSNLIIAGNLSAGDGDVLSFAPAVKDIKSTEDDETHAAAPAGVSITAEGDVTNLELNTAETTSLTVNANETGATPDGDLGIVGITSDSLETLTVGADDDLDLSLSSGDVDNLSTLTTVNATAGGDVVVSMAGETGPGGDNGDAGESAEFSFDITEGYSGNIYNKTVTLNFASDDSIVIDIPDSINNAGQLADYVRTALAALADGTQFSVSAPVDNQDTTIYVTWVTVGVRSDLESVTFDGTKKNGQAVVNGTNGQQIPGDITDLDITNVDGVDPLEGTEPGIDLAGFGDFHTLDVSGATAEVSLELVNGSFDATVTAESWADVTLTNTGVTSLDVTVTNAVGSDSDSNYAAYVYVENAALLGAVNVSVSILGEATTAVGIAAEIEESDIEAYFYNTGMTSVNLTAPDEVYAVIEDAANLTDITIVAGEDDHFAVDSEAWNYLELVDTASVATIDLSGVTDNDATDEDNGYFVVDASAANFGSAVEILIGTSDIVYYNDLVGGETEQGTTEIFKFVGSDIGDVTIDGFFATEFADGDLLDLSAIAGIDKLSDLRVTYAAGDTTIVSVNDAFEGTITVVGVDLTEASYAIII